MPRPERVLDECNGPLNGFAALLRQLRENAGSPGYREMARRAHYSVSTLAEAASGRKLPSLAVTLAYVRACGADVEGWEARWHELARKVATDANNSPVFPAEDSALAGPAPYVGVAAYQLEDGARFFGREAVVDELAARLTRQRFLVVFGASGAGKSSLLRAGLLHRVHATAREDGARWHSLVITPGAHPLSDCFAAVEKALAAHPGRDELLLVVDQFEEVFTVCQNPDQRTAFISALIELTRAPANRVRVVLGVRADFYQHCAEHPDLVEALRDGSIPVGAMSAEQLHHAITRPAQAVGCRVETALVTSLVAQALGQVGALPLVSHALLETWRRRRGNLLTLAGYQAAGGIEASLAQSAESAYASLEPQQQELAHGLLRRLVVPGVGTEDTKRRVDLAELNQTDPNTAVVLDTLARNRLLTLDQGTVELTHEVLIRAWPRLREWVAQDRDGMRLHRQLTDATIAWESLDRDAGALYRGVRLATAREWATGNRSAMTSRERAFLDASSAAQTSEQRAVVRRQRQLGWLAAALAVLVVLATGAAWIVEQQRREAISTALAQKAMRLLDSRPDEAMLLAVQARHQADTVEARSALLSTQNSRLIGRVPAHFGGGMADVQVAVNPTGSQAVACDAGDAVSVWEVSSHTETARLPGLCSGPVAFSRDGKRLAAASKSGFAVWDVTTRDRIRAVATSLLTIRQVAFSPDGRTLAGVVADEHAPESGSVRLWNADSGEQIAMLASSAVGLTWNPNGRSLAVIEGHDIQIWDVEAGPRLVDVLPGDRDTRPAMISWSPDGHAMAVADNHGVRLWNAGTHQITTLTDHDAAVAAAVFRPDGHTLATATSDGTISVLDVDNKRPVTTVVHRTGYIGQTALSVDGNVLATVVEGRIMFWDLRDAWSSFPPGTEFPRAELSPDGRLLATVRYDSTATVWDTATRQPLGTFGQHPVGVAFSHDGRRLAVPGSDGTVTVWDAASRSQIASIPADRGAPGNDRLSGAVFGPDPNTLVVVHDSGVTVWDVATSSELGSFAAGQPRKWAVRRHIRWSDPRPPAGE